MPKSQSSVAPALDRGLSILESLAQTPHAQTLTQIASRVGLSVSEIQRVVAVLQQRGYLVREDAGAYRLSSRLFRIATSYPPFRDLAARALPSMQGFADETLESVHLSVLADDRLLIVAAVEGRGLVRLNLQLGSTQSPQATVSGRVLLARLPDAEFQASLKRWRITGKAKRQLEQRCAAIGEAGFEHSKSELVEGIEDLGVVIVVPDGTALAALTTSWLPRKNTNSGRAMRGSSAAQTARLLTALRSAAQRIAEAYERA